MTDITTEDRFWEKVFINPNGCWEWCAAKFHDLYGAFWFNSRLGRAHRYSYKLLVGEIPEGMEIDHLCRNHSCVNPYHLEAVTRQVNALRGIAGKVNGDRQRSKTHCPKGHPYDKENTYITPKGKRDCRACRKEASLRCKNNRRLRGSLRG